MTGISTNKKIEISSILTVLTGLVSLLMTVVYFTWYIASIEKRVSLIEQQQTETEHRLDLLRADIYKR